MKDMKMIRKSTILPVLVLFAAPAFATDIVETIVARINSEIITLSELARQREVLRGELQQRLQGMQLSAEMANKEKDLLRDLIDNSLLLQKGKEEGINVEAESIKQLDQMRKQLNLASMEDLEKAVTAQGMSFEDYKAHMKEQMITRQVVQREVQSHVQITKEDVAKFYEAHKKEMEHPERVYLRQIMVATDGKSGDALEAAKKKAADLVVRARKPEDFGVLASKESEDASAQKGGDMGFWEKGQLDKQLEVKVFAAKTGDVLEPIEVKGGLLILKIEVHQLAGIPTLAEVDGQIQENLYVEKMQPALREYLTKLRDEAYLEVRAPYVDTGAPKTLSSAHLIPLDAPAEDLTTTVAKAKKGSGKKIYKPWSWVHKG
jgi:peptidyl-prolyl cis-trans isomerase SurA